LHFMEWMPNLKELHLIYMVDNDFPLIYTDIVRNTTTKRVLGPFPKLEFFNMDYSLRNEDINRLYSWFPNITKLRMNLDDRSFPNVCKQWTKLIDFEVLGCKVTDDGILGDVSYAGDSKGNKTEKVLSNHLLNLTELKTFKMNNIGQTTSITDASIIHAFTKLKNLIHLELCSEHVLEGWSILFANEKLTTLIPTDGTWSTFHVERYTRQL